MFLELSHTKLDIFKISKIFVITWYKEFKSLPAEEKYALTQQIRGRLYLFTLILQKVLLENP